jgi:rare lipoprotein A
MGAAAQTGDQTLRCARQGICPEHRPQVLQGTRRRQLVWQKISRSENLDRPALRHVCHDRRPPDTRAALLRSGNQIQSGKSVIVRVTDRGPFHADRIIDLSYTAAYKLGLINGGSGQVEVEAIIPGDASGTTYAQTTPPARPVLGEPDGIAQIAQRSALEDMPTQAPVLAANSVDTTQPKGIHLQLGAFSNADNAENLKNHLSRELDWLTEPMRISPGGGIHRLQLGPYASRSDADRVAEKIRAALGYKPTVVIR